MIAYDRQGYARSGGGPVGSIATHTAGLADLLDHLRTPPSVAVGTSVGATIAIDLARLQPLCMSLMAIFGDIDGAGVLAWVTRA